MMDFQASELFYDNVDTLEPDGSGGGGKGAGASGGGTEAPNTLRSKAIGRFLFLLGEGEIVGLVNEAKSIILSKVPYENEDGSTNYKGLTWALKPGTPDQTALPGFENATSEYEVNLRVKANSPVTYRTESANLDAITVTLNVPALTRLDDKKSELKGYYFDISIDIKNLSNPNNTWVEKVRDYQSGKNTSPYERSYRIDVEGVGPWLVRMRRNTPDHDDDSKISDQTYFSHVTEISDYSVSYADSAILGVEIDVEQLGNKSDLRFDIKGKKINYPSNYDPVTRTFSGFWNGTFSFGWCNDPAWVLMDVLMNPRYGIGIPLALIDKWGLYQLSKYCSQQVSDGEGGMEPRFSFNGTFYNAEQAYKTIQAIASMMRAIVFYGAGALIVRHDAPMAPEQRVYNPTNVVGDFSYSSTAKSVRHNACTVQWTNPAIGWEDDYEVYEDRQSIIKYGYNPLNIRAIGTTSRGQAYRQAKWAVLTEQLQTDTITFSAGLDSASVLPGDIIEVADPHWATADFGGRLIQDGTVNGTTQIKLDRPIDFAGSTSPQIHLTMLVGNPDDVANVDNTGRPIKRELRYFSSNVTAFNAATNVVTLQTAIPDAGNDDVVPLVWIFSKQQQAPRAYKVISNEEDTDENTYQITGLQYSTAKFVQMDEAFVIDYDPGENYSNLPSTNYCAPPTNLRVEVSTVNGRRRLNVSWTPSPDDFLAGYLLSFKVDDENWVELPIQQHNYYEIDAEIGSYIWSVRAINRFGNPSVPITQGLGIAEIDPTGDASVIAITTDRGDSTFIDKDIRLYWTSKAGVGSVQTAAFRVAIEKPAMAVTNVGGEQTVQGGVGTTSTGAIVANVSNVDAPTITTSGTFQRGDTVRATIGQSIFSYTVVAATETSANVAAQLGAAIHADARFNASVVGSVATVTFATTGTNASTLTAIDDPTFKRFRVRVLDPTTNVEKRIEYTTVPQITYTYSSNIQDFVTPSRSVKFAVAIENVDGVLSQESTIVMTNPSPTPVAVTVDTLPGGATFRYTPPVDPDFAGMVLYVSSTNGFVPGPSNLVYHDRGSPTIPIAAAGTYYYKYGFFDSFGDVGIALSAQGSFSAASATLNAPSLVAPVWAATPLSSATSVDPVTGAPVTTLTIDWDIGTNNLADISQYEVEIREGIAGNWIGGYMVGPDTTILRVPRVAANTRYQARVRAYNILGAPGPFSTIAPADPGHLTVKDTVAPQPPSGVSATAALRTIFLQWTNTNNSADTDLAGVEIWENTANNSATATRIDVVNAIKGLPGTYTRSGLADSSTRYYWLKSVDNSGNISGFHAAATAGVAVTPASVSATDISQLAAANFPGNLRPIEVFASLPTTGNFAGRQVMNTTDGKLYRFYNGAFTVEVDGADIKATSVTTAKIAAGAITAGLIAASAVTASKLLVGDTSNMIPDPLHVDTAAWTGTAFSFGAAAVGASVNTLNISAQVTGTNYSLPIPVEGSKPYYFAAKAGSNSAGNASVTVEVHWFSDVTGTTYISGDTITPPTTNVGSGATTLTSPSNARTCKIVYKRTQAGTGAGIGYFYEPVMRRAANGELIVDGSITALKIAALTITAAQIAAGTITSDRIQAGTIQGDRISTSTSLPGTITVGTTGVSIATVQSESAIGRAGNLLPNSDLTQNTDGWIVDGAGTAFTRDLAGASWIPVGEHTIGIMTTGAGEGRWRSAKIPINASAWIEGQVMAAAHRCQVSLRIEFFDNLGAVVGTAVETPVTTVGTGGTSLGTNPNGSGFTQLYVKGQAPATAATCQLLLRKWDTTAGQTDSYGWFTRPLVGYATATSTISPFAHSGGPTITDPAALVNTKTTTIDPGKILISGGTTLANWRNGGDTTKIEGGSIAANSITTNKLTIGNRGLNFLGINFQYISGSNQLQWSGGGYVLWTDDAGSEQASQILSGAYNWPGTFGYIYWTKGSSTLNGTTDWASVRANPNNVLLCTWFGGSTFTANYGGTIVHGDNITTGTIQANKLNVGSLSAISAVIGTLRTATSGQRLEISDNVIKVFDASNVLRVKIGNLAL